MNYKQATEKLKSIKQSHIFKYWDQLSNSEKETLLAQIENIDIHTFQKQQELLFKQTNSNFPPSITPFTNYHKAGTPDAIAEGKKLLSEGKVGCLILAGGQGTRLRFEGPKGLFPVSVIKKKTLFQLFAEKILAAEALYRRDIPLAIMTSVENLELIRRYFFNNQYFGLEPHNVSFFPQSNLPLLDTQGNLFLEEQGKISEGPDGNGSVFHCFKDSGVYEKWHQQGISFVNTILIDNPLADPVDADLIGYHSLQKATVTVKCIIRQDPKEKVGVLVEKDHKVHVEEYTELSETERMATDSSGNLKHRCANISLFCFNLSFISEMALRSSELPLHLASKAVRELLPDGTATTPMAPNAWKFEKFIFDVLPLAQHVKALLYPRENCFAPLKNLVGPDSIATVQAALLQRDRQVYQDITGQEPPQRAFELAPEFHYPSPELLTKWKGMPLPNAPYVTP